MTIEFMNCIDQTVPHSDSSGSMSSRNISGNKSHQGRTVRLSTSFDGEQQPSRRVKATRKSREHDLFKLADAFDSIALSGSRLSPTRHSSDSPYKKYIFRGTGSKEILLDEAKTILMGHVESANFDLVTLLERLGKYKDELITISAFIIEQKSVGVDANILRDAYRYHIALQNHRISFYEVQANAVRRDLRSYAQFIAFLDTCSGSDLCVNLKEFFSVCCPEFRLNSAKFLSQDRALQSRAQPLPRLPPLVHDPQMAFFRPDSPTGQIIQHLFDRLDSVLYSDLEITVGQLLGLAEKSIFSAIDLTNQLFDMAWSIKPFPFCLPFSYFTLPSTSEIIPKVFAPTFLSEEWQMIPFGKLGKWPLKSAVDELFVIMTLTNPFQIADQFYQVIQEIGRCCQRILIQKNQDAQFLDIDFDQIFGLMILVVLSSGIPDILGPMNYSYQFAKYLKVDPEKQFGMIHMEGLCAHLERLDYVDLRRQSKRLLDAKDIMEDPLGVGNDIRSYR